MSCVLAGFRQQGKNQTVVLIFLVSGGFAKAQAKVQAHHTNVANLREQLIGHSVQIRESTENDKVRIRHIHQQAFGDPEGKTIGQLAIDLLEDKTAYPIVSLVAEEDSKIVGHILFTAIKIGAASATGGYILAPLAVATGCQGAGVGTGLITHGLQMLKQRGADFVLVLGDPNYYSRSGFKTGHNLKPPYALDYPQAWMARELKTGVLEKIKGKVQCAASLNSPEHW